MKNANYTIQKKEIFSHSEKLGIALGWNGKQAVTWEFKIDNLGEYDFYWGHYHTNYYSAIYDYHIRLAEAYKHHIEFEV